MDKAENPEVASGQDQSNGKMTREIWKRDRRTRYKQGAVGVAREQRHVAFGPVIGRLWSLLSSPKQGPEMTVAQTDLSGQI